MNVFVIGAGVIGLTTAVYLQEQGLKVTLFAEAFSPHTSSDVAGAIWYPTHVEPFDQVKRWSEASYREFEMLSRVSGNGVSWISGIKTYRRPMGDPWFATFVKNYRRLSPEELPQGRVSGFSFEAPVIQMSLYLGGYLKTRFLSAGGACRESFLTSADLEKFRLRTHAVINCSGFGARVLCRDDALSPVRGDHVKVAGNATGRFFLQSDHPVGPVSVIPHGNFWILGGTSYFNNSAMGTDPQIAQSILDRCKEHLPDFKDLRIIEHRVGLRPARTRIRLEKDGNLIHNYGHGSCGVTLSWGCAREVHRLLN